MPRIRFAPRVLPLLLAVLLPIAVPGAGAEEARSYPEDTPVLKHGETVVTLGDIRRSVELTIPPDKARRFYAERKRITQHAGNFFDPFTRETAGTTNGHGLGLGLTLTKEFCKLINVNILISSKPREGTRVQLIVPYGN